MGRNTRLRETSITTVGRQIDLPSVANRHVSKSNYPAFDQVTKAHCQWTTASTAVEFLSINGVTRIMCGDNVAWSGVLIAFFCALNNLIINAFCKWFNTLFLAFFF